MIIVCDTNVLISAFLFPGGKPDKILRAVLSSQLRHASSPDILTELRKVFVQKFKLPASRIDTIVSIVARTSFIVYPTERIEVVKTDPTDNRILECARQAHANVIVSGDKKHLLRLRSFENIPVISPADFVIKAGII